MDCSKCVIRGESCQRIKNVLHKELQGTGVDGSRLCPLMISTVVRNPNLREATINAK